MFARLVPWASILGCQRRSRHPSLVPWPNNHTKYSNLATLHGWEVQKWVQEFYLGLALRVSRVLGRGNGGHAHGLDAPNLRIVVFHLSACPSRHWTRPTEQPSSLWRASLWRGRPGNEEQLYLCKHSTERDTEICLYIYSRVWDQGIKPSRWRRETRISYSGRTNPILQQ